MIRYALEGDNHNSFNGFRKGAYFLKYLYPAIPSRGRFVRFLLATGILCTLLAATMGNGKTYALGSVNDPVRVAVNIVKPAVVRIYTTVNGRLIVHFPQGNVAFPQTGEYVVKLSGSGTFISAHGDILTADHMVSPPSQVFADVAATDVTNYVNKHNIYGTQMTVDQVNQELQDGQIASDAAYTKKSSEVYLSTDYTGPLNAATLQNVPLTVHKTVDRIERESDFNQDDVAIVHAPFEDTPSVQLGDSSAVQAQDDLTIIGFPGNGDVSDRPTDLLTSSVNKVVVSSIKMTETGAPVIQVGGNVEHGDSGGPALNSQGTVVGIVSFSLATGSPGETSFLQASMSAQSLIEALNLDITPGTFQKEWSQAFTDYSATAPEHWHKAARELASLAAAYPLFQAVMPYLTRAQIQARAEQLPQAPAKHTSKSSVNSPNLLTLPSVAWIIGALVVLLLAVYILRRVALRHRSKRSIPLLTLLRSRARQVLHRSRSQAGMSGSAGSTSQVLHWAPTLPARQCLRGHVISDRMAHFCSECGALVQEVHVQR